MDSRRVIAAQNRARARALRLEQSRNATKAPSRPHHVNVSDHRSQVLLPFIALFVFAILGGYWQINGSPFALSIAQASEIYAKTPTTSLQVNDLFDMGGVKLGMTPDMVRHLHPSAQIAKARNGNRVITLSTPRGMLVGWLKDEKNTPKLRGSFF